MLHSFGPMEIGAVLVILLLIFGAGRLPSVMSDLGKGMRNFRSAVSSDFENIEAEGEDKGD